MASRKTPPLQHSVAGGAVDTRDSGGVSSTPSGGDYPPPAASPIYWAVEFPLVTSRFFLKDLLKFAGLTYLVLVGVSGLMNLAAGNELADLFPLLAIWAVAVAVLTLLVGLVAAGVMGNRGGAIYCLDDDGIAMLARSQLTPLHELAQWLGVLTGNAQLWATGLLAQAEEKVCLGWDELHRVRCFPDAGVLELYDAFHLAMRVYCPAELYATVAARLEARQRPGPPARGGRRILAWLSLCLLGTLLGLSWEPEVNDVGFMVVLTGMFTFMAGLLPGVMHRGLGLFGLLSGLAALGHRIYHALDAYDAVAAALASGGCALLVGMCLYQMFRRERPGQEMVVLSGD